MHLPNPRISCLPAKVPLIMSKIPSLSECWVHAHHFVHIILLILPNNSLGQELLLYHVTEEETGLLTCTKSHSELAPDHKPHSPPANSQCWSLLSTLPEAPGASLLMQMHTYSLKARGAWEFISLSAGATVSQPSFFASCWDSCGVCSPVVPCRIRSKWLSIWLLSWLIYSPPCPDPPTFLTHQLAQGS